MRRLVPPFCVLVLAIGLGSLVSAASAVCHPGRGKHGPDLCRYCPPPEPDCQLIACDRCGCQVLGRDSAASTCCAMIA